MLARLILVITMVLANNFNFGGLMGAGNKKNVGKVEHCLTFESEKHPFSSNTKSAILIMLRS